MEGDDIVRLWQQQVATQRPPAIPTPYGPVLIVSADVSGQPVWLAGPFLMEEGGSTIAAFENEADALQMVSRYAGTSDAVS